MPFIPGDFHIEVDWDRDGDWGDDHEDVTALVLRGSFRTGRDYASHLTGRASPGQLRVELLNTDDLLNPFNASSDLYGLLKPGALVRVRDDADGLWIGRLSKVKPNLVNRVKSATLEAVGILAELANQRIPPLATASGDDTGSLIADALTAAGYTDVSGIETGDVSTGAFGSTEAEVALLDEMRKLEEVEFGFLHEDQAEYRVNFHKRTHRAGLTTLLAVFADDLAEALHFDTIEEEDWVGQLFNRCIAGVSPFSAGVEAVVWTAPGPYYLSPSGTQALIAQPSGVVAEYTGHTRDVSDPDVPDPEIVSEAVTAGDDSFGTSGSMNNPATVNSGNLLVMAAIVTTSADDFVSSMAASGWTFISVQHALKMSVGWLAKEADGSEAGGTTTVTWSGVSGKLTGQMWAINHWDDALSLTDVVKVDDTTDNGDSTPNHSTTDHGWEVPTLMLSVVSVEAAATLTSPSAGFSGSQDLSSGTTGRSSSSFSANRLLSNSDVIAISWTLGGVGGTDAIVVAAAAIKAGAVRETVNGITPSGTDPSFTFAYDTDVGGNPQTVENVEVTGVPLVEGDVVTVQADYAASQDALEGVGIRTYRNRSNLFRNLTEADSYAELVVLFYGEARPVLKASFIANASQDFYDELKDRRVGDRITVTATASGPSGIGFGIDEDFIIEAIEVEIQPLTRVTWYLSQAFLSDPFTLDSSLLDGLHVLV